MDWELLETSQHEKLPVIILGGGESGVGAAMLAKFMDLDIFVSDFGSIQEKYKEELTELGVPFEENGHTEERILAASCIIKSPGIPEKAPIIQKARAKKIPIFSELEWGAMFMGYSKTIAVTGSNVKTTTTSLIGHILKQTGDVVKVCGNIGDSASRIITRDEEETSYFVLEVSSFQLDDIDVFMPDIAVLLNITPDHLDRYDYSLDKYAKAKMRIAENQRKDHHFIINEHDEQTQKQLTEKPVASQIHRMSVAKYLKNGKITVDGFSFKSTDLKIKGSHNLFNAICAVKVAKLLGINNKNILKGLQTFEGEPHRLEFVRTIKGVEYINDTKATNVDAVFYALDAMEKPIVWIIGGIDKGNDYEPLMDLVEEKVKAIVCLGADNTKLLEAFSSKVKVFEETQNAVDAVNVATKYAERGDVVLLSPACSSFDLFKNYKERGDRFKEAVKAL